VRWGLVGARTWWWQAGEGEVVSCDGVGDLKRLLAFAFLVGCFRPVSSVAISPMNRTYDLGRNSKEEMIGSLEMEGKNRLRRTIGA
jgi:hypothetical protein